MLVINIVQQHFDETFQLVVVDSAARMKLNFEWNLCRYSPSLCIHG